MARVRGTQRARLNTHARASLTRSATRKSNSLTLTASATRASAIPAIRSRQLHERFAFLDESPRRHVNGGHPSGDGCFDGHLHFHGFQYRYRLALFDLVIEGNDEFPYGTSNMRANFGGHGAFSLSYCLQSFYRGVRVKGQGKDMD
jgi:hypothetical protein